MKTTFTLLGLAACPAAMAFTTYSITDLGDLPGGPDSSYAFSINDNGVVTGTGTTAQGAQAFRWDSINGMVALPLLAGRTQSLAGKIDSAGNIAGVAFTLDSITDGRPLAWTPGNQIIDPGLPVGWTWAINNGINEHGVMAGWGESGSGRKAFTWSQATGFVITQPLAGDAECGFSDINNNGVTSGWSGNNSLIWQNGVPTVLTLPPNGVDSYPNGLSEENRAYGYVALNNGNFAAGVWNAQGKFSPVDQFPGYPSMDCSGVSDNGGLVVCEPYDTTWERVVLWSPIDGDTDMDTLIDSSTPGWNLMYGGQPNKRGQIVGNGTINGVSHAFLATPVVTPNNTTINFGQLSEGGLKSLEKPDGDAFRVSKFFVPNLSVAPITVVVEATCPVSTLSSYFLRVKSKMTKAGFFGQTLDLFDWSTNSYSAVDTRSDALGLGNLTVELHATGSLNRYLGPDRTLRARYRIRPTGTIASQIWGADTDCIEFVARP